MTFNDDLKRFVTVVRGRRRDVYVGVATDAHGSIKVGSAVTGAPGQPVDSGFLANSWTLDIGVDEAVIATNVAYAEVIEDNDRSKYNEQGVLPKELEGGPVRKSIKSTIGGHHSVKLTIAGANRIQETVRARLGA